MGPFLFASPAENFPCVILEAMASACCVVATPTSGVTEQIEDGRNVGFPVSQRDGAHRDVSKQYVRALRIRREVPASWKLRT